MTTVGDTEWQPVEDHGLGEEEGSVCVCREEEVCVDGRDECGVGEKRGVWCSSGKES